MLTVALPALNVPLPIDVAPSKKLTMPVGVPAPLLTVAVNVIDWAKLAGLTEVARAVVVATAEVIDWDTPADVLDAKFPSVWYEAVIKCAPRASEEVVNVACPAALRMPVPTWFAPSKNNTAPVGVPPALVTVAVNVTDWPTEAGLPDDTSTVLVFAGLTV